MGIARDARRLLGAVLGIPRALVKCVLNLLEMEAVLMTAAVVIGAFVITALILWAVGLVLIAGGEVAYEIAKIIDTVVNIIVSAINKARKVLHFHAHPHEINLEGALKAFHDPTKECAAYNSFGGTIAGLSRNWGGSRHVCPTLRYVYSTFLYNILHAFIGWMSYDAAPEGANCHRPSQENICLYVVNLWRIPTLLAILLTVTTLAGPCMPLIIQCFRILWRAQVLARHVIVRGTIFILRHMHAHIDRQCAQEEKEHKMLPK